MKLHRDPVLLPLLLSALGTLTGAQASRPAASASPAPTSEMASAGRPGWFDLNADGRLDLVALTREGRLDVRLATDDGFVEASERLGLAGARGVRALVVADLNGDRYLDLFAAGGVEASRLYCFDGVAFLDATEGSGLEGLVDVRHARALDVDGDRRVDLFTSSPAGSLLHTALGQGLFETSGVADAATPLWSGVAVPTLVDAVGEVDRAPSGSGGDDAGAPRPGGRRPVATTEATRGSAGSGGFATTTDTVSSPVGELAIAPVGPICADTLMDQETGGCLEASSTPTLGTLYPLSTELFVDATTGNVGLGTISPGEALQIGDYDRLVNTLVSLQANNGSDQGLRMRSVSDFFGFDLVHDDGLDGLNLARWDLFNGAFGSSALFVDRETGFVGLGTTAPMDQLELGTNSTPGDRYLAIRTSGGNIYKAGIKLSHFDDANGFTIESDETGPVNGLNITHMTGGAPESALFIDRIDGDVGIGTVSPVAPLDVATGSGSYGLLHTGGGVQVGTYVNGSGGWLGTRSNHRLNFFTNDAAAALTLDTNGRVGIGTTAPTDNLHVRSAGPAILRLEADTDNSNEADQAGIEFSQDNGLETGFVGFAESANEFRIRSATNDIDFDTDGALRMRVTHGGNVGIGTGSPSQLLSVNGSAGKPGGGSWSVFSDRRLKKNVEDLDGALATLLELRGVTFEYKDAEAIGELEGTRTGFIAQEVEAVLPDWVEDNGDYKQLTIRGFEALAVEALRELSERNDELVSDGEAKDARIAELEARVARLEGLEVRLAAALEDLAR